MRPWNQLRSAFANLTGKRRAEKQLSDEMTSYVELLTQRNINEGMNDEEARRAALLKVGGVEQVKEQVRESRAGFAFETLLIDLRWFSMANERRLKSQRRTVNSIIPVPTFSPSIRHVTKMPV